MLRVRAVAVSEALRGAATLFQLQVRRPRGWGARSMPRPRFTHGVLVFLPKRTPRTAGVGGPRQTWACLGTPIFESRDWFEPDKHAESSAVRRASLSVGRPERRAGARLHIPVPVTARPQEGAAGPRARPPPVGRSNIRNNVESWRFGVQVLRPGRRVTPGPFGGEDDRLLQQNKTAQVLKPARNSKS